jgi:hypothetical protein
LITSFGHSKKNNLFFVSIQQVERLAVFFFDRFCKISGVEMGANKKPPVNKCLTSG